MLRKVRDIVMMVPLLLVCMAGHATTLAPYPMAKMTVNGTEQSIGGSWDNGNITIDFNGFLETVHYGQYSSDASLASALAAMFTRDYLSFGLYAKAGANSNTDPTAITFQLVNGSSFGPLNVTGPSTSFTFTPTGFAITPSGTPDQGTATLLFNGAAIATASYGDGSTPASIAQDLALKASSSLVTVTAEGSNVYLQSKQTGTYSDTYSLSFSTSASFSSSAGGTLSGSSKTNSVPVYSYNLGYDAVGNVTTLNDSVMGNWSYANGYDNLNRLVSGQASSGSYAGQNICWSYDSFGNRTHQSISNQPFITSGSPCQPASGASLIDTAVSYGTNNRISSVTNPALTVGYDGAGNVTNDGNNSYLYDAEGRICALNGPQGMVGYQYDAAGNRVGRGTITSMSCDVTQNGYQPASDYVLDLGGGQMTEVSVGNGQSIPQHTNVTANGTLIATYDTTGLHFYVNDALGSRRVQTDLAGFPEQTCQNLPFGDQLYCTGSLTSPTEHHFTGKERDSESGLDYFGARHYGSNMGRFMSPDDGSDQNPGDPQNWNLYSYGRNNPLINTDPTGRTCQTNSTDGAIYDDGDGKGCSTVDIENNERALSGDYDATVSPGNGDTSYQLAVAISNFTDRDSLLDVAANGLAGAQAVEGLASIPGLLRDGWEAIGAWRLASKMDGVRAAGQVGEAAAGIIKNTERIPSLTGTAKYRVPDILDHSDKIIGEVKNYTKTTVALTAQIKDDIAYAQANGYTVILQVAKSAGSSPLTGPLQQLVDQGSVKISEILGESNMNKTTNAENIRKFREQVFTENRGKRQRDEKDIAILRPMLDELAELGYVVETLDDLRHQGKSWKTALPVLLRWLPKANDPGVKQSIVRCISVPWTGNKATAELIEEFKQYAPILPRPSNPWVENQLQDIPEEEKEAAPFFSLAWAIGNALSIVDVTGFETQIIRLSLDVSYGISRQMLVITLAKLENSHAEVAALKLLNDEDVKLHAIIALGKMRSQKALPELERLSGDKRPVIRKEARKAIQKISSNQSR